MLLSFKLIMLKNITQSSDIKRIKKLEKFQLSHQSLIKLSKYAKKLGLIFFYAI